MTTKNITEHYKKYGVIEGDKLLLETAKNNYQKGYDEARKEADEEINKLIQQKQMIIEKEGYPASDCIAVLRKEIKQEYNEEKAELIEKIKIAIREEVENSDEVYMSRIDNILDTFKQAEKIE